MKKHKENKDKDNKKQKKSGIDELFNGVKDDEFIDEDDLGVPEEIEEDGDFIKQVKEFEKHHKKAKLIKVYKAIGEPDYKKLPLSMDVLKEEYSRLIGLLDNKKIYVHFQNEYPKEERYRFIIEEVFNQDIENEKSTFVFEDFHPEFFDGEDDEE